MGSLYEFIVADVLARTAAQRQSGVSIKRQWRAGWILFFVRAAAAKEAAQKVPDKPLSAKLIEQVENSIEAAMDKYCGTGTGKHGVTPSRPKPGPMPGPPPGLNSLVVQLTVISNLFHEGTLRTELSSIAGRLLQKGIESVSISG